MHRPTLVILLTLKAVAFSLAACGYWKIAAAVFFGPDLWVFYNLFVPSAQGLCRNFTRFETTEREIWLTIDDGPDPQDTPRLLDLLDRHRARATFFLVGERVARWPELAREIVRRGHEIGHHTHTHPSGSLWCASRRRLETELDSAIAVLAPITSLRWFRPPVGIKHFLLPRALAARKLEYVGWSLRSGDCLARSSIAVENNVRRHLRPGVILLMHEGPSVPPTLRVTALSRVMDALAAQNYRCVIPDRAKLR
ncbi:MAG: acetyl xylan esterase [Verrucomicrobia bacterium]|nr:acetyl xylan esterase [Verrucomicrobiota bacterium]